MSDLIDPDAEVKPRSRPAASPSNADIPHPSPKTASGRVQRGKCPNVGECSLGGTYVEVPQGASFVCPECGSELLSARRRRAGSRRKLLFLFLLVAGLCLLGVGSFLTLGPFLAGLFGPKSPLDKGSSTAGTDGPPLLEKREEPPLEKKPTLADAEAALRKELPRGITLVSLKPNQEQKGADGSWNLAYDATVVAENDQYWVPIADLDAANLRKRLSEIPSPERSWARRHLKDLILTQDQAPGQEYLFHRKKPLASLTPGTPFPFAWKAVATPREDGSWKFVPASPLPFAAPAPSEGGTDMRVVLRSSPEVEQAQSLEEQRWDRFVQHLKEIERRARQQYREVMNNAPSYVRKPDVFRAGSGGPTTMGEGAGIGAAGGALGGAMFGGGEGAAIGAGVGMLLGALGGGVYSHQKQQKQYEAALAERHSYERQASSAERNTREQLLSQYEQDLQDQAQQRLTLLAGGSSGAANPAPYGGNLNNPGGGSSAMPRYPSDGSGPPPMPPLPTQEPYGSSSPAGPPAAPAYPDGPPPPFAGNSPYPPADSDGPPPPPPPPPPY
ncbi:hypothetical protein [Methylacidimicrobium tartarophylax]|uniref:Uncharacterized protein n=1 Tax=Methylacidimicrobium tartarophylax TaxID=1041768 RepID=A0A5E6M8K3_9BACT|nr:hypothetical protein [Methylacidimicrobium tartarophylax]VVM04722.1 hypothetical protein MAMT_00265 [Methylacidimicrobium tartarophylax]